MNNLGAPLSHMLDRPNDRRKELLDKYSHLLKKGGNKVSTDINDPFNQGNHNHDDNYEVIFEEMERLKESEYEARMEVLKLENYIRMSRMLQRMKTTVMKQEHDYKIDNLKQQLSSNAVLWEQLAEAEKREKILKQELMKVQNEVAAQDKVLDRLRDEMKLEQIEKHKLIQFKTTKVKRLNHLEGMAKQMELMQSIDMGKVIQTLSDKDKKLAVAMTMKDDKNAFMNEVYRVKAKEVDRIKQDAAKETVLKEAAITKMEEMRQEIQLLKGDEETTYHLLRDEINQYKSALRTEQTNNDNLKTALHQISSQIIDPSGMSSAQFKHDDSVYSTAPNAITSESRALARQFNPFGDTKNNLIKKINTEAYLGQPQHAQAKFTASQSMNFNGRNKQQLENIVLNGIPNNEINIDITPNKQQQMMQKNLLGTLSDGTIAHNSQVTATTKARTIQNLNNRSGDINSNNLNSLRMKNSLRGNKANLAFGSRVENTG